MREKKKKNIYIYIERERAISWHIQADYLRGEGEKDMRESDSLFSYSLKYFLTDKLRNEKPCGQRFYFPALPKIQGRTKNNEMI